MPRICAFYGISIWMYHDEGQHSGRPHFHARYGSYEASVDLERVEIMSGELPRRAWRLVIQWTMEHRPELRDNWQRARRHLPLHPIEPLR